MSEVARVAINRPQEPTREREREGTSLSQRPPAAAAAMAPWTQLGTGRASKAPRTEGSDDEGPALRGVTRALDAMQAAIDTLQQGLSELQVGVSGLEGKVDAKLLTLEQQVLPAFRTSLLREMDQKCQSLAEVLENKLVTLTEATDGNDRAARAANLVVYGLPEHAQEEAGRRAAALFQRADGPPAPVLDARRLGPRGASGRTRPRPLLLNFQSVSAKHAALNRSRALRGQQVYLDTDLTLAKQAARTALRPRFLEAKRPGGTSRSGAVSAFTSAPGTKSVRCSGRRGHLAGRRPPTPPVLRGGGGPPATGPSRATAAPPGTAQASDGTAPPLARGGAAPPGTGPSSSATDPGLQPMAEA